MTTYNQSDLKEAFYLWLRDGYDMNCFLSPIVNNGTRGAFRIFVDHIIPPVSSVEILREDPYKIRFEVPLLDASLDFVFENRKERWFFLPAEPFRITFNGFELPIFPSTWPRSTFDGFVAFFYDSYLWLTANKPRYGHRFDNIVLAALAYREAGVQDVIRSVWDDIFYDDGELPEDCPRTRALVDGSLDEWVKVHDWTVFPCAW